MGFKFFRFFYHYYNTPPMQNPFIIVPPKANRNPRPDDKPAISVVSSVDEAEVEAVARVLRISARDATSTRAQFRSLARQIKGAEIERVLKDLQRVFVRNVQAMGFDGWLYKVTLGGRVVGGAFLERVDADWRRADFRGACRAFWVVRSPDEVPRLSGSALHDGASLRHMREMHGKLYTLVDRLSRQQVFVLTAIGLRTENRGKGIGSQLLQHIETQIGKNNVIVVVSDSCSQSFFAKNGFEVAEEPGMESSNCSYMPTRIMLKNHEAPVVHRRS